MAKTDVGTLARSGTVPWSGPSRFLSGSAAIAVMYLAAITAAEALTALEPSVGLPVHALILGALLFHGGWTVDEAARRLLWGLALAPLIRMVSLSLPLGGVPIPYWYAIISAPIFAAFLVVARVLGYSRRELGLTLRLRHAPLALLMVPLGLALGIIEYLILLPRPLAPALTLEQAWRPILILIFATGFFEELVFRGLLQDAAIRSLGTVSGLLYGAMLFASLHVGYRSMAELALVFPVGLLFGLVTWRTDSILGPTLAHAANNVTLLLIAPLLLPAWVDTGPRTLVAPPPVVEQQPVETLEAPRVVIPTIQPRPAPAATPREAPGPSDLPPPAEPAPTDQPSAVIGSVDSHLSRSVDTSAPAGDTVATTWSDPVAR